MLGRCFSVCLEEPAKSPWRPWTPDFQLSIATGRNITVRTGGVTAALIENDFRGI